MPLSRSDISSNRVSPIKVLIVDDSASIRAALSSLISDDPGLALIAAVPDAFAAVEIMRKNLPDVMLLDLEMPKMDGLTFLRKIMAQRPLPVVVCSSYTNGGSDASIRALEYGAIGVIAKPRLDTPAARREAAIQIGDALRAAAQTRRRAVDHKVRESAASAPGEKLTADAILPALPPKKLPHAQPVIAIGASTGGTEALRVVLEALPADAPGIVVVQHMPENFTNAFARRLNGLCAIEVREAQDGDVVRPGLALIAPGNRHLLLRRSGSGYRVGVVDGPCVSRHRPSVDVLFRSTAQAAAENALGIILTGMGDDGAKCMLEMQASGAVTLAQDEESCVVYGMPREAVAHGGVTRTVSLLKMPAEIMMFAAESASPRRRA